MATKRQIEANRQNAKRSTGPTTVAGRARSRRNALKHGLTAQEVTVDDEEADKFEAFRDDIVQDLAPVGALEEALTERVAMCLWRLRRVPRLEVADTVHHEESGLGVRILNGPAYQFIANGLCQHLTRYEIALERSLQRALHDLDRLQARRRGERVPAPIAVDVTHSIGAHVGTMRAVSDAALPTTSPAPAADKRLMDGGNAAS
jgi:hypothetical protein